MYSPRCIILANSIIYTDIYYILCYAFPEEKKLVIDLILNKPYAYREFAVLIVRRAVDHMAGHPPVGDS
jgi:hypothetical protein